MIIFSIQLRAIFEPKIFALSNPFFHQDIYLLTLYLFISGLFHLTLFSRFPINPEHFYDKLPFRHNLAVAAVYWIFSLVDFSRLIGSFPDAILHSQDIIFMPLLSDFSAVYSAIFNHFCQCIFTLFLTIFSFNVQWTFYLIIEFKLSNYYYVIVLLLRLD